MKRLRDPMPSKFDALARYNAEVARGLVHTAEYRAQMASRSTAEQAMTVATTFGSQSTSSAWCTKCGMGIYPNQLHACAVVNGFEQQVLALLTQILQAIQAQRCVWGAQQDGHT